MTDRPIIMSGESVRAILEGRKTMTRRVIKHSKPFITQCKFYQHHPGGGWWGTDGVLDAPGCDIGFPCPYGEVGDRLWVREAWGKAGISLFYKADGSEMDRETLELYPTFAWKSPLFMPRAYSRLTLEIVNVRVQRVQEISEQDAIAEGIPVIVDPECPKPNERYAVLWDFLNAKRGYPWASNPWVFAVEFKRVEEK